MPSTILMELKASLDQTAHIHQSKLYGRVVKRKAERKKTREISPEDMW